MDKHDSRTCENSKPCQDCENPVTFPYFTGGWTHEDLKLLAKYDQWQTDDKSIDITLPEPELRKAIQELGNVGDTELRKLYANDQWLIFISIDTGIEVVVSINKENFEASNNLEL